MNDFFVFRMRNVFQMRKMKIKKGDKRPPNLQDSVHFTIIGLLFVCWVHGLNYSTVACMYDAPGMLYHQFYAFSQSKLSPFINLLLMIHFKFSVHIGKFF